MLVDGAVHAIRSLTTFSVPHTPEERRAALAALEAAGRS